MTPPPLSVIIADDHQLIRDGLKSALEKKEGLKILSLACNGKELVQQVKQHSPDIVITDIRMPVMDGIEATRIIRSFNTGVGIIALSFMDNEFTVVEMLEAGADGYLNKDADISCILEAIRKAANHLPFYCPTATNSLGHKIARSSFNPYEKYKPVFTRQEITIIRLISKGMATKEISCMLKITPRTVDAHRRNILNNLNLKSSVGITIYAIKNNIIRLDELP